MARHLFDDFVDPLDVVELAAAGLQVEPGLLGDLVLKRQHGSLRG